MLRFLLAATLATHVAVKDTIWWRTEGAVVVQLSSTCSMVLSDRNDAAILTWNKAGAESVAFGVEFPLDPYPHIAVRIGETPLEVSKQVAGNGILLVPTKQPLADLLRNATEITVAVPNHPIRISVNQQKMPALLSALDKCRAAIK